MRLPAIAAFGMMPIMHSQPHRGRKWRRFVHDNRNYFFAGFFLVLILAVIAVMFWVMTSPEFIKFR
jgi:phosphotransferase system  glucose/maltose/N-acetylglucosamine-specific IIC component